VSAPPPPASASRVRVAYLMHCMQSALAGEVGRREAAEAALSAEVAQRGAAEERMKELELEGKVAAVRMQEAHAAEQRRHQTRHEERVEEEKEATRLALERSQKAERNEQEAWEQARASMRKCVEQQAALEAEREKRTVRASGPLACFPHTEIPPPRGVEANGVGYKRRTKGVG
jgi:hypothetical protein